MCLFSEAIRRNRAVQPLNQCVCLSVCLPALSPFIFISFLELCGAIWRTLKFIIVINYHYIDWNPTIKHC
jgi:hypothetical protein